MPTSYGQAVSLLVENLVSAGWSYQASGDGLSGYSSSSKVFTGTATGALGWNNPNAWARIQDPSGTRELVFQHNGVGGTGIKYSPFAKFTSGGSATAVPTATDERNMRSLSTSTTTVTISAANPGVVTWASHGLVSGSVVTFTTTGSLPTPLTANTLYYVSQTGNTSGNFQLATTPGGASIDTTAGGGSGTHTAYAQQLASSWLPPGIVNGLGVLYGTAKDTAPYGFWFAASQNFAVTFANGSSTITGVAHGLAVGSLITFSPPGTLPTNFTAGVTYFVVSVPAANTFTVSTLVGGTAITAGSAGTGTATGPRTSLVFDPVTSVAEDPDPYVIHIGATNAFSLSTSNYGRDGGTGGGSTTWSVTATANGGTTEGCFAIMDVSRANFLYVQPAGYALSATAGSAASGFVINMTGAAVNPFNSKYDALPFPYVRIQEVASSASQTTVQPGVKGWSTLCRWTGLRKATLLDTLDGLKWVCLGGMWLPWDGTTTPIG